MDLLLAGRLHPVKCGFSNLGVLREGWGVVWRGEGEKGAFSCADLEAVGLI